MTVKLIQVESQVGDSIRLLQVAEDTGAIRLNDEKLHSDVWVSQQHGSEKKVKVDEIHTRLVSP